MRIWLMAAVAAGFVLLPHLAPLWASEPLDLYDSEKAAHQHCGKESVVWLDVPSKTYWVQGQSGYGLSKTGGYTCRADAMKTGNHASGVRVAAHQTTARHAAARHSTPRHAATRHAKTKHVAHKPVTQG